MNKFSHISSIKDIDDEILRTELKKKIIREDLSLRVGTAKQLLRPATFGLQLLQILSTRNTGKSLPSFILRVVTEIINTAEASKYGFKLLKRIFR